MVDLATGWLVDHQVLLPGITTLTRIVARIRQRTARAAWRRVNSQVPPAAERRLTRLLDVDPATKVSQLELLRRPPRSPTIDGLIGGFDRLSDVQALNVAHLDLSGIPAARLKTLVDDAGDAWVQRLARRTTDRRKATLADFASQLHRSAHDDVIDAYLAAAGDLFSRAERAATKDRLATLADLDAAALVLRRAALVLLDDNVSDIDVRRTIFELVGRDDLQAATDIVGDLLEPDADDRHRRLLTRYPTLRRFWPKLLAVVRFESTVADDTSSRRSTISARSKQEAHRSATPRKASSRPRGGPWRSMTRATRTGAGTHSVSPTSSALPSSAGSYSCPPDSGGAIPAIC